RQGRTRSPAGRSVASCHGAGRPAAATPDPGRGFGGYAERMTRLRLRRRPEPSDAATVRRLTRAAGGFSAAEVDLAVALVKERLARGPKASGYHFLFAKSDSEVLGYACYGPIPLTRTSWDLYWIAVAEPVQGRGIGRRLLQSCEDAAAAAGAQRLY